MKLNEAVQLHSLKTVFTSLHQQLQEANTCGHFSRERNARQVQIVGDRRSSPKVGPELSPSLGKHRGANKHEIVFKFSFFPDCKLPMDSQALCFGPKLGGYLKRLAKHLQLLNVFCFLQPFWLLLCRRSECSQGTWPWWELMWKIVTGSCGI